MNAIEVYEKATKQLGKSEITLGEYEKMIKPLENVMPLHIQVTNGEVIRMMFPSADVSIRKRDGVNAAFVEFDRLMQIKVFPLSWWNAPYNKVRKTCGNCKYFNGEHACCQKGQFVMWNHRDYEPRCDFWSKNKEYEG